MENKEENIQIREEVDLPSTTYATFGFYPYPAKFIPHVPAYIIENYAKSGMSVFDPYAGYGTVGIVSRIYNHDYELWDLNPILEHIHKIAIEKPQQIDIHVILDDLKKSKEKFVPDWSNHEYWYSKQFLPFFYQVWGFYHSLEDCFAKNLLTIPLLRTTRYFSYDDQQRMKLSKSKKSINHVDDLLSKKWKNIFIRMLEKELIKLQKSLHEYQKMGPKSVNAKIRTSVDTYFEELEEKRDILITSPPYLQSQEYIRYAKNDLFWLGYKEKHIKRLSKLEIPYRDVKSVPVESEVFITRREEIQEQKFVKLYNNYFWGILGPLTRLQEKIQSYMFIFVGRSSLRGSPVKIDKIFAEHFSRIGWSHMKTLVDAIPSRRMFDYVENPASGINDRRTTSEYLVILKKD